MPINIWNGNYTAGNVISSMENLEGLVPYINANGQPTLLGYLVGAYNSTQGMWYGEIYNDQVGHYNLGGHASSILNNDRGYATVGLEKVPETLAGDNKTPTSSHIKGAKYALTIDAYDWSFYVENTTDTSAISASKAPTNLANVVNVANAKIAALLGSDASAPEFIAAQNHTKGHTETRTVVPAQYTNALKNAQNNLTDVQKNQTVKSNQLTAHHQSNLQSLTDQKNAAVKKANDAFDATVKHAAAARDSKIAEAKGSHSRVDQFKQELDQKYQDLVKADQAKIAQIEAERQQKIAQIKQDAKKNYDAKVAKINADSSDIQAKIDALLQSHKDFVKANADKLAQLKADDTKAYNDLKAKLDAELAAMLPKNSQSANDDHVINTKDHTVVLPDKKSDSQATVSSDSKSVNVDSKHNEEVPATTVDTPNNGLKTSSSAEKHNNTLLISSAKATTNNGTESLVSLADKISAVVTNLADADVTAHQTNKQRTLPSTGNYNNWGVIALGAIAAMFGLGLTGKKRHV
ncbi:LPXTG cell wall anchor domain-containing protein [Lactobacillus reuteri]|nr:LPXTG cell wall anchor domain-containing protein [Limosilactobacillus reuteri]